VLHCTSWSNTSLYNSANHVHCEQAFSPQKLAYFVI